MNHITYAYDEHIEPHPVEIEEITEAAIESLSPVSNKKVETTAQFVELPRPARIEEITEVAAEKIEEKYSTIGSLSPASNDKVEITTQFSGLSSLHKFPNIKWHQTETHVVLTIHAPDVQDYYLKIGRRLIHIW